MWGEWRRFLPFGAVSVTRARGQLFPGLRLRCPRSWLPFARRDWGSFPKWPGLRSLTGGELGHLSVGGL